MGVMFQKTHQTWTTKSYSRCSPTRKARKRHAGPYCAADQIFDIIYHINAEAILQAMYISTRYIFKINIAMEQFRNQLNIQASGIFHDQPSAYESAKVETQIFDNTLPSELQFQDQSIGKTSHQKEKKNSFAIGDNLIDSQHNNENKVPDSQPEGKIQVQTEYQILTKPIVNFHLRKCGNSSIFRQNQHTIGSYIPFPLNIKTFQVKFYDQLSELNKGVSSFKLFWQNIVGYSKVQIYIKNGFIYLLERKKQGFLVQTFWDLQNLFKIFSDQEQNKLRLVFRIKENQQYKLLTKQFQEVDLNVLSCLISQAKDLQFKCEQ